MEKGQVGVRQNISEMQPISMIEIKKKEGDSNFHFSLHTGCRDDLENNYFLPKIVLFY